MQIGVVGTGKMGTAIGKRLLARKHTLSVWNRTPARAQPLAALGAVVAATPSELATKVELVISIVTDEAALEAIYFGANGLLAKSVAGQLFIDMSTVRPAMPRKIAARVEIAGATMKLAINLPLMVYWQTLGEALSLIQPLGLDPKRVIEILAETSGGPNMLKTRGPAIAQALSGEPSAAISVNIATMRKDVRAMLAQGEEQLRQLPLTALTLKTFDQAAASGLDAADCTQLLVWWLSRGRQFD